MTAATIEMTSPVRLLSGMDGSGRPEPYHRHLHRLGPLQPRRSTEPDHQLIDLVYRSGLLGRGGAGFPTGRKMRSVADAGKRPVLVANGMEGEPAAGKDRLLLARLPHLVLDGMVLAARAVGAVDGYLCVHKGAWFLPGLYRALMERDEAVDGLTIKIEEVPERYVSSEKSALVSWLNGGAALPLYKLPPLRQRGVNAKPTLVQNVETLAQLALIARRGSEWFRSVGAPNEPGTVLVTVGGAVARPGVFEIASGTPIGTALSLAGALPQQLSAVLVGGYFGGWLPIGDALHVPLSHAGLKAVGRGLGAGVLVALPAGACGLVETARVARYLADETAGQCGPCQHGLPSIADAMTAVAYGARASAGAVAAIQRWSSLVEGRGACSMPDGAVKFVSSAWTTFAADVARHTRFGPCPGVSHRPVLPIPRGGD